MPESKIYYTTIVGESWSIPTPTISSRPFRSPTCTIPSTYTPHQDSHDSSTICLPSQQTFQFRPIPLTTVASDVGIKSTPQNSEDIDDEIVSFLSG